MLHLLTFYVNRSSVAASMLDMAAYDLIGCEQLSVHYVFHSVSFSRPKKLTLL